MNNEEIVLIPVEQEEYKEMIIKCHKYDTLTDFLFTALTKSRYSYNGCDIEMLDDKRFDIVLKSLEPCKFQTMITKHQKEAEQEKGEEE